MSRSKHLYLDLEEHIAPLRHYALALARDGSAADDLVQETIVKALAHRDQFERGTNLRAWLFTILRNTYHSHLRRSRLAQGAPEPEHPSDANASQDLRIQFFDLQRDFSVLTQEQREALILVAGFGYSYEEAARILKCPVGTIRSRLKRGREKLLALREDERKESGAA